MSYGECEYCGESTEWPLTHAPECPLVMEAESMLRELRACRTMIKEQLLSLNTLIDQIESYNNGK